MNISITGTLGSGKSSVCKILKENGYDIISNGVLFREIAEEKSVLAKNWIQLFLTPAWAGILFRTVLRCSCWQI